MNSQANQVNNDDKYEMWRHKVNAPHPYSLLHGMNISALMSILV